MLMQEYWKIQEQEKDLLKEIAKWKYRAKHFSNNKLFLSDAEISEALKTGIFKGSLTAQEILNEYKIKLQNLKTKEYRQLKRFFNKKQGR
jgi:hypothetical protein